MTTDSPWKAGDPVWIKTGVSAGDHEELGSILAVDHPGDGGGEDGGVLVKLATSGYESLVTERDRIRPMEGGGAAGTRDARGRTLRRSGRGSNTSSVLETVGTVSAEKKFPAGAVSVTPSPTELDSESPGCGAMEEENPKPAAAIVRKRKRGASAATAAATNKKAKAKAKSDDGSGDLKGSPYFAKGSKKSSSASAKRKAAKPAARGRTLILASSEDEADGVEQAPSGAKKTAAAAKVKGRKRASVKKEVPKKKPAAKRKGKNSGDDEADHGGEEETSSGAEKTAAAVAKGKKRLDAKNAAAKKKPPSKPAKAKSPSKAAKTKAAAAKAGKQPNAKKAAAKKKPAAKRKSKSAGESSPTVVVNQPDGNGGLNQPSQPWVVEYSKTGRATCRTCDERIGKGEVRVGHAPLFRGKPGYMVYRHLRCVVFTSEIRRAEDVQGHTVLDVDDYAALVEQVEESEEKREEEEREIRPDELVQKTFQGEIRSRPEGLAATLLPFQVEGFSWMRHQEVEVGEIRGGILADEMGMGKTIQAIATILDNRPKLQHAKPGMKHPPTSDLPQRQKEELLWEKSKRDWSAEMELLKVPKKLRSRDGGARAGTLVVCPVIALTQWRTEIEKFTDGEDTLKVGTYHGPDREKETPRELMKKYDVVLTTYQVLESDFRKMTSPNRVQCPNCGGKFKIDKLPIHLKYFCGDTAQRTEAQSRQVRNSDRGGGQGRRGRQRPSNAFGRGGDGGGGKGSTNKKKTMKGEAGSKDGSVKEKKKLLVQTKKKDDKKKSPVQKKKPSSDKKKPAVQKKPAKRPTKKPAKKPAKKPSKKVATKSDAEEDPSTAMPRTASRRSAARAAASRISRYAAEWAPGPDDDDSDGEDSDGSDDLPSDDESSDEEDESGDESLSGESSDESGGSSSDDSALERAREKQRQALETSGKSTKKTAAKKGRPAASKAKGARPKKKPATKGNKKKKFDDDSDEDYSSDESASEEDAEIDMQALMEQAMAGAKNSVLHSVCWWRIILDEAHFIKTRSSQTANAAFSLIGVHRWCLSGTPLQNRVGEFYSLVRFLRLDPMAYYFCRCKDCDCKSMHYRIHAGICEGCGHGGIQHYSHFNKYILNPIQRDGYTGDGRRAMFLLKNEVLDKALLRRTKETRAADMELPPRLVQIKAIKLHPVEEDFYSALYTQTKSSFNDYVDSGTLLNNYAHIFDLLIRMRQSVDHPYLVVYSNKNMAGQPSLSMSGDAPAVANGSVDCDLCHEPPTDRVVSTCCGVAYCRTCVLEYMATSTGMASVNNGLTCPSCREAFSIDLQARADIEDDSSLNVTSVGAAAKSGGAAMGMPSLKELKHVATGSILRRINLAEFATSSKIEALTRELVLMRQSSPGSKAIVFSQFVNMLDLIRWRLHSDPYLEDIGLGCRALHGGMNVKARDACLKDFREDNNVRVLLMSLKAGGVALNLTCANYIYLMDPWWNPAAEMQAIDRTHRLGQYRPIRAVRFIAENTVEERILQLQEKKRLVFDGTVGRDAGSLKMLTVDDMKSLFA